MNPWGVKLSAMFHMSNDSGLFRTREELIGDGWELRGNVFTRDGEWYLPLYEAKLFHQYDHRFATFDGVPAQAIRSGNARAMTSDEKADPETVVLPRYWVPEEDVMKRLDKSELTPTLFEPSRADTRSTRRVGTQLALRKIARATDERTGIYAMIPSVGLSDSGTTILVGSLSSGTLPGQQTSEHRSSRPYKELQ